MKSLSINVTTQDISIQLTCSKYFTNILEKFATIEQKEKAHATIPKT